MVNDMSSSFEHRTKRTVAHKITWGWFNIKMSSHQYRKSHCGDKTILRPSYLHNGISYSGKMTSLYWIRAQGTRASSQEYRQNSLLHDDEMSWWPRLHTGPQFRYTRLIRTHLELEKNIQINVRLYVYTDFCTSGKPYHIKRSDPISPSHDGMFSFFCFRWANCSSWQRVYLHFSVHAVASIDEKCTQWNMG